MTQDSKLASRGNSFEIENLIKVCFIIYNNDNSQKNYISILFIVIILRVLVKLLDSVDLQSQQEELAQP